MSKIPSDDILESLYKLKIREPVQLKIVLELYDMEIHQKMSMPNYQKLTPMVKRSIYQKLRMRNFEVRHRKIESRAVVKSRKRRIDAAGGKVAVSSGKKKTSVRKETDADSGTESKTVHKNQNTLSPRLLSQPLHKVEVSRGREVSEAKVAMGPFFAISADII